MAIWNVAAEGIDWLSSVEFFEGFNADQLARVLELSTEVSYAPGEVLIDQGDTGVDCFVVVEGSAAVYIGTNYVASVPSGSLVGEMAMVDQRPRTASVIAESPLHALRFDARHFAKLLTEMPKVEERIMALLTARLRANG